MSSRDKAQPSSSPRKTPLSKKAPSNNAPANVADGEKPEPGSSRRSRNISGTQTRTKRIIETKGHKPTRNSLAMTNDTKNSDPLVDSAESQSLLLIDTAKCEGSNKPNKADRDDSSMSESSMTASTDATMNTSQTDKRSEDTQKTKLTAQENSQIHSKDPLIFYDDEEINHTTQLTSSDEYEFFESGTTLMSDGVGNDSMFVVQPLGCCEIDEVQLMSANSTKAIQKCILHLLNRAPTSETLCWGLDQSEPVLMTLLEDHIQFTHLKTRSLLRSQPIQTIKTWAVDDDNNFAFVVEESSQSAPGPLGDESLDSVLLSQPTFICYVFSSMDDDDMSCKVATKLNEEINRYREHISNRVIRSNIAQQVVVPQEEDLTDAEDIEELEASSEATFDVKYIGKTQVPRPLGIDVLNAAIDKCLSSTSGQNTSETSSQQEIESGGATEAGASSMIASKLYVSPSSVIIENKQTGEIIVECRIRFLTFICISRRDIRWFGFIMQNTTTKSFEAHCIECSPTAGRVCEVIQVSCARMYEKVVKTSKNRQLEEPLSIVPSSSMIRDTLAKTFSKIRLNPMS